MLVSKRRMLGIDRGYSMADNHHAQRGEALSLYRKYLNHVMKCAGCADPPVMCPMGRALKTTYRDATHPESSTRE